MLRNVGRDARLDSLIFPAALEGRAAGKMRPAGYSLAAFATATTAAQIRATSSSLARYGGIV
jgi:hypothetical protein